VEPWRQPNRGAEAYREELGAGIPGIRPALATNHGVGKFINKLVTSPAAPVRAQADGLGSGSLKGQPVRITT